MAITKQTLFLFLLLVSLSKSFEAVSEKMDEARWKTFANKYYGVGSSKGSYYKQSGTFVVGISIPGVDGKKPALCGGSLITTSHVLTAAHCFDGVSDDRLRKAAIYLNSQKLDSDHPGVLIRGIKLLSVHPSYSPKKSINNIAILALNEPVQGVQLARLPTGKNMKVDGKMATIYGWTSSTHNKRVSQSLAKTNSRILNKQECSRVGKFRVEPTDLCSMSPRKQGKVSCEENSGSPIIVDGMQVGIVGQRLEGSYCTKPGSLSINTRVSSFINWIETKVGRRLNSSG